MVLRVFISPSPLCPHRQDSSTSPSPLAPFVEMVNTLFFKVFYLFAFIALSAPNYASAARRDDAGHLGRVYGQFGGVAKRLTNAQRLSRGLPPNKPVAKRNGKFL